MFLALTVVLKLIHDLMVLFASLCAFVFLGVNLVTKYITFRLSI